MTSDHACTVRKRVCRTINAPVSTIRTLSLPQDPATWRTRANISMAIRLTSQWIRPVAITPYMHTCIYLCSYNIYFFIPISITLSLGVIVGHITAWNYFKTSSFCRGMARCCSVGLAIERFRLRLLVISFSCNDYGQGCSRTIASVINSIYSFLLLLLTIVILSFPNVVVCCKFSVGSVRSVTIETHY